MQHILIDEKVVHTFVFLSGKSKIVLESNNDHATYKLERTNQLNRNLS